MQGSKEGGFAAQGVLKLGVFLKIEFQVKRLIGYDPFLFSLSVRIGGLRARLGDAKKKTWRGFLCRGAFPG